MGSYGEDRRVLVIKFGGRTLSDPVRIRKCAEKVASIASHDKVVVVVSAMGDQTSNLISMAHDVTLNNPKPLDTVRAASFGEMISATLFASSLEAMGCAANAVIPYDETWPIIASEPRQSVLSVEKINEDRQITIHDGETRRRVNEYIIPMMDNGQVPVICGFLATDPVGTLTTLGRGGSDTTAFILGKYLHASEVIIVTDQQGVLKADPATVDSPEKISVISTDQLDSMARSGARVLHPHSLVHKTPDMKARVVNFESPDITQGGTLIEGFLRATLRSTPYPLALLNIVGEDFEENSKAVGNIVSSVTDAAIPVYACSLTPGYLGVFVKDEDSERAYHVMHGCIAKDKRMKSLALKKQIARVTISSPKFQDQPGILAIITRSLGEQNINVIDLVTLQGDISVFIDWAERERVIRTLRRLAVSARLDEVLMGN